MQVDTGERGFSYAYDAPLDMRMDPSQELDAREVVNDGGAAQLAKLPRPTARSATRAPIAREIVRAAGARRSRPPPSWSTPSGARRAGAARFGGGHPAKRIFQAIRIAVNDELEAPRRGAAAGLGILLEDGRLGRDPVPFARGPARQALPGRPRAPAASARPTFRCAAAGASPRPSSITRRAVVATPGEVADNPRSKSGRLRVGREAGGGTRMSRSSTATAAAAAFRQHDRERRLVRPPVLVARRVSGAVGPPTPPADGRALAISEAALAPRPHPRRGHT